MTLINKKAQTVQVKGINKLIAKYGHNCTVVTGDVTDSGRLIFGKSKSFLESGTLINANEYRLLLRVEPGMVTPIPASTHVTVNGIEFFIQTVMSIGPNAADPIVWELTCAAGTVPADVDSILAPTIETPADETSDYPYYSFTDDLYSIQATSSAFTVDTGSPEYVSSDWEIALDDLFETIVDSEEGFVGYTWTSNEVLSRDTNYFIRVRYNGSNSTQSDWSAINRWSLDTLTDGPVTHINKPTIQTTTVESGQMYSLNITEGYGANDNHYRLNIELSAYSPVDAGAALKAHWQIATDEGFTTDLLEFDSTGGYDDYTSTYFDSVGGMVMPTTPSPYPYPLVPATWYYARGKYISVDAFESEYTDTLPFWLVTAPD